MKTSISRANIVEAARIFRTNDGSKHVFKTAMPRVALQLSRADVIQAFDLITKNRTVTDER